MVLLTKARRDQMAPSQFALPGERFPIGDPEHQELAIGGATRAEHAGNITKAQESMIKRKARAKLAHSAGSMSGGWGSLDGS